MRALMRTNVKAALLEIIEQVQDHNLIMFGGSSSSVSRDSITIEGRAIKTLVVHCKKEKEDIWRNETCENSPKHWIQDRMQMDSNIGTFGHVPLY